MMYILMGGDLFLCLELVELVYLSVVFYLKDEEWSVDFGLIFFENVSGEEIK